MHKVPRGLFRARTRDYGESVNEHPRPGPSEPPALADVWSLALRAQQLRDQAQRADLELRRMVLALADAVHAVHRLKARTQADWTPGEGEALVRALVDSEPVYVEVRRSYTGRRRFD